MSRTQIEISLGIFLILLTSIVTLAWGLQEEERMQEYERGANAQAIEVGASLFETYCSRCHGTQGLGIAGLCPPLNDRYFFDQRLKEVGWSGTLEDYIVATASGGRLASTRPQLYPGAGVPAMPAFGEAYAGPLREDQVRDIAAFILNWSATATEVSPPPTLAGPPVGTDITKTLPEGDAAAGEALTVSLACVACHISAPTGPAWLATAEQPGIGTRAEARLTQDDYSGNATSAEQYLLESIVLPETYLVAGYPSGVMPNNYSTNLTEQQVADIIAYLLTLK
jgi:mono/diheme cytochrome c family protein